MGVYPLSEKEVRAPPPSTNETRQILICSLADSVTPASKEGGYNFRDKEHTPLSTSVHSGELTEEYQLL